MQQRLHVPTDYIEVIQSRRKKQASGEKYGKRRFDAYKDIRKINYKRENSISGDQVNWLKIKIIRVIKTEPETIFVKSDWKQDHFVDVNIADKQYKKFSSQKKSSKKICKYQSNDQLVVDRTVEEKKIARRSFLPN